MRRISSIIVLSLLLSSCSVFSWMWNKVDNMGSKMPVSDSAQRCRGDVFCSGQAPNMNESGDYPSPPAPVQYQQQPMSPRYQDQGTMPQGYAPSQSQIYNMQMPQYQQPNPYYQGGMPNTNAYGQPIYPNQPRY